MHGGGGGVASGNGERDRGRAPFLAPDSRPQRKGNIGNIRGAENGSLASQLLPGTVEFAQLKENSGAGREQGDLSKQAAWPL